MQELKHYRTLPPPPQKKKKKKKQSYYAKDTNGGGKKKATMEHSETEHEAHCISHFPLEWQKYFSRVVSYF